MGRATKLNRLLGTTTLVLLLCVAATCKYADTFLNFNTCCANSPNCCCGCSLVQGCQTPPPPNSKSPNPPAPAGAPLSLLPARVAEIAGFQWCPAKGTPLKLSRVQGLGLMILVITPYEDEEVCLFACLFCTR